MEIHNILPWGRSKNEYLRMFDLCGIATTTSILDCAAGPASFNAEMTREGYRVVSCDPMYRLSPKFIGDRIDQARGEIMASVCANRDTYVWDAVPSPEALEEVRSMAMKVFLEDFPEGVAQGRYLPHALPKLRFDDGMFDLALCSHFLFTYSDELTGPFHVDAVREMCRVAREARIFPLLDMAARPSPHLAGVIDALSADRFEVEVRTVGYEFQRAGSRFLRIFRKGAD